MNEIKKAAKENFSTFHELISLLVMSFYWRLEAGHPVMLIFYATDYFLIQSRAKEQTSLGRALLCRNLENFSHICQQWKVVGKVLGKVLGKFSAKLCHLPARKSFHKRSET